MSKRSDLILVSDMLEAVERILAYTAGMSLEQFAADFKTSDAVLRNLQVLGEAAQKVSHETKTLGASVEWTKVIRSRHILVHEYFGIDQEIIWRIITVHLPLLREQLQELLATLQP
ncbi:MAG: hypothetical protein KIPDCIKN_03629 [Haliscomenobacter sp.]|jgi:uncharacterized protein with HEPN domain|nr:hypothetical protein [Haliscomenobacter sp.]